MPQKDLQHRIEASFAQQGLMRVIEARIAEVSPGRCTIEAPFRKTMTQQQGFLHARPMPAADYALRLAGLAPLDRSAAGSAR